MYWNHVNKFVFLHGMNVIEKEFIIVEWIVVFLKLAIQTIICRVRFCLCCVFIVGIFVVVVVVCISLLFVCLFVFFCPMALAASDICFPWLLLLLFLNLFILLYSSSFFQPLHQEFYQTKI